MALLWAYSELKNVYQFLKMQLNFNIISNVIPDNLLASNYLKKNPIIFCITQYAININQESQSNSWFSIPFLLFCRKGDWFSSQTIFCLWFILENNFQVYHLVLVRCQNNTRCEWRGIRTTAVAKVQIIKPVLGSFLVKHILSMGPFKYYYVFDIFRPTHPPSSLMIYSTVNHQKLPFSDKLMT